MVGAGIAGLACARSLAAGGCEVDVFDKGRGVSGRMSTRRAASAMTFDHGAQYFTARDSGFRRQVDSWVEAGVVGRWDARLVRIGADGRRTAVDSGERFVGVPSMSSVCRHLARGLRVRTSTRIVRLEREGTGWRLVSEGGVDLGLHDAVVVAVPAAQAAALLGGAPSLRDETRSARMRACIAVMVAFENPLEVAYDGAFVDAGALGWIARDSSKPGRAAGAADCWVLHARHEWSEARMDHDRTALGRMLLSEFFSVIGCREQAPVHQDVHLWRYALADQPLTAGCLYDARLAIGACGDWCEGGRVEAAFHSGSTLAERLLQSSPEV